MADPTVFHWYASADAERYTIKEDSRDAAISAATHDRLGEELDEDGNPRLFFYIVEARKADLRIADFCLRSDLFDEALDNLADSQFVDEHGASPGAFECTPHQKNDLRQRLRAACDEWQEAHGLRWESYAFHESRNEETIVVPLPSDAAPAETAVDPRREAEDDGRATEGSAP